MSTSLYTMFLVFCLFTKHLNPLKAINYFFLSLVNLKKQNSNKIQNLLYSFLHPHSMVQSKEREVKLTEFHFKFFRSQPKPYKNYRTTGRLIFFICALYTALYVWQLQYSLPQPHNHTIKQSSALLECTLCS